MADTLLSVRNIRKTLPGVVALDGVQLDVGRAEVHALLGENGAGKMGLVLPVFLRVGPSSLP
jgi:inositol transport system ATP-binding protein